MKLLLVEDEVTLRGQIAQALREAGHAVDEAANGVDGQHLGETEPYDAVVLDLGLPGRDGLAVLRAWRVAGLTMPVLILTARASWQEKVHGIDAGADDYLAKPFRLEELLARLRALIRRSKGMARPEIVCGRVKLDPRAGRLSVADEHVALTPHEYRVIEYLMHHAGELVSRSVLAEHVYEQDLDRDSNTLDVFIARLRRKLPAGFITTVRGQGFRVDGG